MSLEPGERSAFRPPRNKPLELAVTVAIAVSWLLVVRVIYGGVRFFSVTEPVPIPGLVAFGAGCWLLAELVARRRLMLWPGSALGILGPLSLGLAASILTPELRALPPIGRLSTIYGTTSFFMLLFLVRFRLPGLVSPVALFGIVALFLALKGANPSELAKIEGLTPRGVLAALLDSSAIAIGFALASAAMIRLAWHYDRHGDWFGLEVARPLHIVGAGMLSLILARWMEMLPTGLDAAAILGLYAVFLGWSLRIDRLSVFSTSVVAMTRPLVLSLTLPFGFRPTIQEWSGLYTAMVGAGTIAWLLARRRTYQAGWTLPVRNIRWKWTDPAFQSRRRRRHDA